MENINLYLGELVGTAFFMVLGLGVCANISLKNQECIGAVVYLPLVVGVINGVHCCYFWTSHRCSCKSCSYYRFLGGR